MFWNFIVHLFIIDTSSSVFVKLEELHIATARKPLIHQNQPVAWYLHKKTAMYVVVYAGRLIAQNSVVEIINW